MTAARRILIAGNWKMNGLHEDGVALVKAIAGNLQHNVEIPFDMLICPPYTLIGAVVAAASGTPLKIGAQDCHTAGQGAHTGDISASMLADAGCSSIIVGHSERRADHGETDDLIKIKAEAVHSAGLIAIICIGETDIERDAGETLNVVKNQIAGSIPNSATAVNTVVAYEPVWAIGTGRTPTSDEVQDIQAFIRSEMARKLGLHVANGVRLLYGGSMNPSNAGELLALADVDGGLIGGASLNPEDFWTICENCH
jgi:triosephosphate isomerase